MKKQLLIIYAIILGLVCLILPSPGFSAAGDLVWEFPSGGVVESSPTISGGFVYVGSNEGKVYCLDALTGIEDWYSPTGHYVSSSPAVSEGYVYVGSRDSKVYCLNEGTGGKSWKFATGGAVKSSPAVIDGYVYVGSDDHKIYCIFLMIQTKKLKWSGNLKPAGR